MGIAGAPPPPPPKFSDCRSFCPRIPSYRGSFPSAKPSGPQILSISTTGNKGRSCTEQRPQDTGSSLLALATCRSLGSPSCNDLSSRKPFFKFQTYRLAGIRPLDSGYLTKLGPPVGASMYQRCCKAISQNLRIVMLVLLLSMITSLNIMIRRMHSRPNQGAVRRVSSPSTRNRVRKHGALNAFPPRPTPRRPPAWVPRQQQHLSRFASFFLNAEGVYAPHCG